MLYVNVPEAVGVPLMVIVLDAKAGETPAGSPVAAPMPVAPVVECVMFVSGVFAQSVGVEEAEPTVLQIGRKARRIAAFLADAETVTVPFPVAPVVDFNAQAALTEPSSWLVVVLSNNSTNEVGFVAAHPE